MDKTHISPLSSISKLRRKYYVWAFKKKEMNFFLIQDCTLGILIIAISANFAPNKRKFELLICFSLLHKTEMPEQYPRLLSLYFKLLYSQDVFDQYQVPVVR